MRQALHEDVGGGDLTAALWTESLCVPVARVLSREPAVLCGTRWLDHVFQTLDPSVRIESEPGTGNEIEAGHLPCPLSGSARALRPIKDGCFTPLPELGFGASW